MASIVFALAGSALGSSLGFGTVGSALVAGVGGLVGNVFDNALLGVGRKGSATQAGSLQTPMVLRSSYGEAIPVVYGTARVAGQVLWMAPPRVTTETQTQRVRTGKFSSRTVTTSAERIIETDILLALTAVPSLLAETRYVRDSQDDGTLRDKHRGGMTGIRRLWMEGALVYDARTHNTDIQQVKNFTLAAVLDGREEQLPPEIIENAEGVGNVPAFRGIGGILLQDLRLSDYGGRLPNITAEVVASLPRVRIEESPEGLAAGSDGIVYASCRLRRTVAVIDSRNWQTLSMIGRAGAENDYLGTLKSQPGRMAVTADGHLWVLSGGDACVQRLHPTTGAVLATIPCGYYPQDIIVDNTGLLWITLPLENRLQAINATTNTVVNSVTVPGCPWWMARGGDGHLWITTSSEVVRFNPATGSEIARIGVGLLPAGITRNPVSGLIWIAVTGEDVLRVIDPATNTVVKTRNTGTWPAAVSCADGDSHGSVAVSLLYGNQLKVYSRTYSELLEYGTIAFPGNCLHLPDGKVVVTQARYDFVLGVEGR